MYASGIFSEKCGMALAPASIIAAVVLAAVAAFGPGKGEGFLQSLAAISCCPWLLEPLPCGRMAMGKGDQAFVRVGSPRLLTTAWP